MNTMLIFALIVLTVFASYKKVPLYGFYDLPTCFLVLFMVAISLVGLYFCTTLDGYFLIFGLGLADAFVCCYGVRSRYSFKIEQTAC